MIINPNLWDDIPDEINWVCKDISLKMSMNIPVYSPIRDLGDRWATCGHCFELDSVAINALTTLSGELDCLPEQYRRVQRPFAFNGLIKPMYFITVTTMLGIFEVAEVTNDGRVEVIAADNQVFIFPLGQVHSVNGILFERHGLETPLPNNGLMPEVHNDQPVDGYRAMDILRGMLT